ncbi:MAG TPA: FmdB family zinc ribbon protein [Streptosporangiaceae bacterium]|nr:FmdB family zinc ribbon protein [Streptosporangiaceae bacterium]
MPTYQYACTECGEQLEKVQKFSDDPLTVCPNCSGRLRKVFSPVGIVFKGSGFYRTDSRTGPAAGGKDTSQDGSSKDGTSKDGTSKDGTSKDGGKEKAGSSSKPESSSSDKTSAKSGSSGSSSSSGKDSAGSGSSGRPSGSTSEKVA